MKIRNSLKSLRARHRDNQLVRRKGRIYIINKVQKRFKARRPARPRGEPECCEAGRRMACPLFASARRCVN